MNKTWGEIRTETLNLGAEKIKAYEKNKTAYIDAFNYAQSFIASILDVLVKSISISVDEETEEVTYDLVAECENNNIEFAGLSEIGVIDHDKHTRIDNIDWVSGRFLTLPKEYVGTADIYVQYIPAPIDTASPDDTPVEIPRKWATLMPYLMANRLYMDDDPSLAGYYWNLAEDMKNQFLAKENMPLATVVGISGVTEFDWGEW